MNALPIASRLKTSIYVYAIVSAHQVNDIAIGGDCAVDGLWTIAAGRFAAVVGAGLNAEVRGRSREDLVLQLVAHQKAVEQITQATAVLPVKFGTFVPDEESVRAILVRGQPAFRAAFDRLEGCVQVEILVKWDVEAVFAAIADEEAVAGLREKWERNVDAPQEVTRLVLGRLVKDSLERRRAALAAELSGALCAVSVDAITYPITTDQVVLHLVLLMKADKMAALDRCLETLDAAHDGRLTCRCVGPLAPYSFATVEIEIVEATTLAQAMRLLDIGPAAGATEVRAAYHRVAKSVHPDAAGTNAEASAAMAALKDACRILSLNAKTDGELRSSDAALCNGHQQLADRLVFVSVQRQEPADNAAA